MKNQSVSTLARLGVVAALYVALTYALSFLSYGAVQFRVSEMLMLLCFYRKDYCYALTVGCAVANLFSPMVALDLPFGTLATLAAALLMTRCGNVFVAALMPVITNAVVIPIELYIAFGEPIWLSALTVGGGEAAVMLVGAVIFKSLERNAAFMSMIKSERTVRG